MIMIIVMIYIYIYIYTPCVWDARRLFARARPLIKIHQRGVQWKQGVVAHILL